MSFSHENASSLSASREIYEVALASLQGDMIDVEMKARKRTGTCIDVPSSVLVMRFQIHELIIGEETL